MFYSFDVVERVVCLLQQLGVDPDSVTLEEAKALTYAVILEHRVHPDRTAVSARALAKKMFAGRNTSAPWSYVAASCV